MAWFERLIMPAKRGRGPSLKLRAAASWFGEDRPEQLIAMRATAENARRKRPKDAWAHAAFATALVAGVRAGHTDDLHEDALAALDAAEKALTLAPSDPYIMALAAPALVRADPHRAAALYGQARRKLGARLPEALARAAAEGAQRPQMR